MSFVTAPFPLIGNLVGLPNGWARGLGIVGGGSSYLDDYASISFVTGPMVNPAGNVLLFIIVAQELGKFTDGIDPTSTMRQDTLISYATQSNIVQRISGVPTPLHPATRYSFNDFSVKSALGAAPPYWSPLVWNLSGDDLSVILPPYGTHTLQT